MLDNHPRQQLRFIIENYGRSIIDDPRRCRGMLKDLAPKHIRETNLLMLALDNHIVAALMQKTHTPLSMHLDILAQRLHNNFGTQKEFAFWAVESWAFALDVIQQPSAQTIITPKLEPVPIPENVKPLPVMSSNKIGKFIIEDGFEKDGIAVDTKTNLVWLRFSYGQRWENDNVFGESKKVNWHDAMEIPEKLNQQGYAGYKDWRVPTITELESLIDKVKGTKGNYIDSDVFLKNGKWFWSCSPSLYNKDDSKIVVFDNGLASINPRNYEGSVRLVRG
jgi:hypothetical protein